MDTPDWSKVRVTPEMEIQGADQLRRWCYGQDLQAVVRNVFYAMQNAAFGKIEESAYCGRPANEENDPLKPAAGRVILDWDG